jgi:hypothetical protein
MEQKVKEPSDESYYAAEEFVASAKTCPTGAGENHLGFVYENVQVELEFGHDGSVFNVSVTVPEDWDEEYGQFDDVKWINLSCG